MIRVLCAVAALAAAALLVALAIDVGRWQHSPSTTPATLVGGVAGELLGTSGDVELGHSVRAFVAAERVPYGFDNGQQQTRARVEAEGTLSTVASETAPRRASQAEDLLGVLAWGSTRAPRGVLDPADQAVQDFTESARLNPGNVAAAFNLEVALRALRASGARPGPGSGSSPSNLGRSGAGNGSPGQGY